MTHLERARLKLDCAESRKRHAERQEIPYNEDAETELCNLNMRREEIADAEFEIEVWKNYIAKWNSGPKEVPK